MRPRSLLPGVLGRGRERTSHPHARSLSARPMCPASLPPASCHPRRSGITGTVEDPLEGGSCPNRIQRSPTTFHRATRTAESCGSIRCTQYSLPPLYPIWTRTSLKRVFHGSGEATSSGMTGGRRQRCRGTWIVRRAIARRDEGRAPDLVPTRRAGVIWTSYVLSGRSCRLAFQLRRHPRDRAGRRHLSGQKSSPLSQDVVVEIQLDTR